MISLAKSILVLGLTYTPSQLAAPVDTIQKQDVAISTIEINNESATGRRLDLTWDDVLFFLEALSIELCCKQSGGTLFNNVPELAPVCLMPSDEVIEYNECRRKTGLNDWNQVAPLEGISE